MENRMKTAIVTGVSRGLGEALARTLLAQPSGTATSPDTVATPDATWRCPRCGTPMTVGPILTTYQLAAVCLLFDTS